MADFDLGGAISNNAVIGGSAAAALAMLYKVWQILKKDRKEDNLDNVERSLRDELRAEIKVIKEENQKIRKENIELHEELANLKAAFSVCKSSRPPQCPLILMRLQQPAPQPDDVQ